VRPAIQAELAPRVIVLTTSFQAFAHLVERAIEFTQQINVKSASMTIAQCVQQPLRVPARSAKRIITYH
jgi:hypothetical protein